MKRTDITHKIFLVEFDTSAEAAKTFLRFQEYYESPEFKGRVFALKEYIKWYKNKTKSKIFTYYTDWSGFNIPSWVLSPFVNDGQTKHHFENLSKREKAFLKMFEEDVGDFYIIGVKKGKSRTLDHEIMHGLYYTDPDYRYDVDKILESSNTSLGPLGSALLKWGYHESVIQDEIHAHLADGDAVESFGEEKIDVEPYQKIIIALKNNYHKHMEKHNANLSSIS